VVEAGGLTGCQPRPPTPPRARGRTGSSPFTHYRDQPSIDGGRGGGLSFQAAALCVCRTLYAEPGPHGAFLTFNRGHATFPGAYANGFQQFWWAEAGARG
jgi:hypothetical protein